MAARRDLTAYQGDTFAHEIRVVDSDGDPVNVSSWTVSSQVRKRASYSTAEATFAVNMAQAATGVVVLSLPHSVTADLEPGKYRYDVQRVVSGNYLTLIYGEFDVVAEVTR